MNWMTPALAATMILGLSWETPSASAASLDVGLGQTFVVSTGQLFDYAVVRNGGVLVLDGGLIGTNALPSVLVEEGGRFVFNSGAINYFENRGVAELYGGTQSTSSSENRGYLKIAGGDPGTQIGHFDGTVDVYHTATNRTAWEIDSATTNGDPQIRFFSLSNSLAAGSYTFATLTPTTPFPGGKTYHDLARFWTPSGTQLVAQVDVMLPSNWPGKVWSYKYTAPTSPTSSVRTAVEISWTAVSGRTYQVQATTNLISGPWRNLELPTMCESATGSVFDAASDTNKTYRVLLRH